MSAYYSEIDPFAAEWLRRLIVHGEIAPGEVDERSIEDVSPDDLRGFTQCHFFAGIGVWSYALRRAGWPDDRPVWTGSCPCQPFSAAGKGSGFADERHLWPAWDWLIGECRPGVILGEQVGSPDALKWLDLVSTDLEGKGYAFGTADLCAAGFGAPHIRQRLFFVAHDAEQGREPRRRLGKESGGRDAPRLESGRLRAVGAEGVADTLPAGRAERWSGDAGHEQRQGRNGIASDDDRRGGARSVEGRQPALHGPVVDSPSQQEGLSGRARQSGSAPVAVGHHHQGPQIGSFDPVVGRPLRIEGSTLGAADPLRGRWAGADWIWCRDGKYRPVEPGTFPLAHGAPARVGRLRSYGNAICAPVAEGFIQAVMEAL